MSRAIESWEGSRVSRVTPAAAADVAMPIGSTCEREIGEWKGKSGVDRRKEGRFKRWEKEGEGEKVTAESKRGSEIKGRK